MKKSRNCIKRERPEWWTPEKVLERLESGQFVLEICELAAGEMQKAGVTISVRRLRSDISTWTESASWGDQFRSALALWKHGSPGEMVLSKHWYDDFFAAMMIHKGNAAKAAEMAGVGYGIVLALTDRRNKCYDSVFTERFKIAELERVGRIREKYTVLAEDGEGKAAVRAQERIIEAALPGLHGQKQELHVSGKVEHEHEHQHTHGVSAELAQAVVAAGQERIRRINAGRMGLLPADTREEEGRVIDVGPMLEVIPPSFSVVKG